MTEPKPLDTRYKGYLFRSRLEARWAVVYDALGLDWIYEMEGFDLGDGLSYLPDFFFPDLKIWIEIKGENPTLVEIDKADRLATLTGQPVYIFFGNIPYPIPDAYRPGSFTLKSDNRSALILYGHGAWDDNHHWCECPVCGKVGIEFQGFGNRICGEKCQAPRYYYDATPRFLAAYQKARSARFEHGAQPR